MTTDNSEHTDGSGHADSGPENDQEPVVVRDRRRIDPETGERRSPDAEGTVTESMSGTLDDELAKVAAESRAAVDAEESAEAIEAEQVIQQGSEIQQQVHDLTADLKRVTAEYANYRKRVERDREAVITSAKAGMAEDLLAVLDDIERADAHGDLTGAFKAVADKLTAALDKTGLQAFGQEGDEFDPSVHEAVQHATSSEVSGPTVTMVMRRGYRMGERVLRPAMVGVTDYEADSSDTTDPDASQADQPGEHS